MSAAAPAPPPVGRRHAADVGDRVAVELLPGDGVQAGHFGPGRHGEHTPFGQYHRADDQIRFLDRQPQDLGVDLIGAEGAERIGKAGLQQLDFTARMA